jgi:muramoyltetrapeptide carboxypeptidase
VYNQKIFTNFVRMIRYSIPPPLAAGDKGVIVSPSGCVDNSFIDGAAAVLENWGLHMETAAHAAGCNGSFSGTAEERLYDMQTAMDDESVRLIFCSRGGYGAVHLLDRLNIEKLKASPKWLVGYSDITALHQLFLHHRIVSLHAPMAKHLTENTDDDASRYLKAVLFGQRPRYIVEGHPLNREGTAVGTLFGGNMAVFCSLLATKYAAIPQDGILFIEDIGERPYRIDRMMWILKLSGVLERIKGLLVGNFSDCGGGKASACAAVYGDICAVVEAYDIPVSFGFPVGHTGKNYPLLHGGKIKLTVSMRQTECVFE